MYSNQLYSALNPTFFLSLLSGTNPIYAQNINGKYVLKSSLMFKFITMAYVFIYSCSLIYEYNRGDSLRDNVYMGNAISSIGRALDILGQIILIYAIYILSFVLPPRIQNIIERICTVDSIFEELGHKINYRKIFWQQVSLFVIGLVAITFNISISMRGSQAMLFIYYFPIIIIFIMECQFSFLVFLIYQRFKILNEILQKMFGAQEVESKNSKKIATLMEVYDSLVDLANDINRNYTFQILICFTLLFIKTVFAIFFAYYEYFVLGAHMRAVSWGLWSVIDWNEILLLAITCQIAATQARQTGVEVHKLLMNSRNNDIKDKLTIFSQQIFHCPVQFTACGLFTIDSQLLFTIIGSGTVYLLIMLQFQEGTEEANCNIANATAL
ncbi:putative gustatory receptor 28b [Photinus pyralis]|uniref:putative gustatory receptor 28b n=1 Tax=Photinus pyralis TaxID=7054 RepID=UPI0012671279|nr:putative gustatory receptor 28b [Photinus pyralis]